MVPERLVASRIVLARHSVELAAAACEAIEDSLAELAPWQPWAAKFEGLGSCVAYSEWVAPRWGRRFDFQILDASSKRFLGQIALERYRPDVPAIEIGYWLRTSATGHGYATEAARTLMKLAFEDLRVARIELLCDARNVRSAAVAQRLGMTLEGVLRNERRDSEGLLQNTMLWSQIAEEWRPNVSSS